MLYSYNSIPEKTPKGKSRRQRPKDPCFSAIRHPASGPKTKKSEPRKQTIYLFNPPNVKNLFFHTHPTYSQFSKGNPTLPSPTDLVTVPYVILTHSKRPKHPKQPKQACPPSPPESPTSSPPSSKSSAASSTASSPPSSPSSASRRT